MSKDSLEFSIFDPNKTNDQFISDLENNSRIYRTTMCKMKEVGTFKFTPIERLNPSSDAITSVSSYDEFSTSSSFEDLIAFYKELLLSCESQNDLDELIDMFLSDASRFKFPAIHRLIAEITLDSNEIKIKASNASQEELNDLEVRLNRRECIIDRLTSEFDVEEDTNDLPEQDEKPKFNIMLLDDNVKKEIEDLGVNFYKQYRKFILDIQHNKFGIYENIHLAFFDLYESKNCKNGARLIYARIPGTNYILIYKAFKKDFDSCSWYTDLLQSLDSDFSRNANRYRAMLENQDFLEGNEKRVQSLLELLYKGKKDPSLVKVGVQQ